MACLTHCRQYMYVGIYNEGCLLLIPTYPKYTVHVVTLLRQYYMYSFSGAEPRVEALAAVAQNFAASWVRSRMFMQAERLDIKSQLDRQQHSERLPYRPYNRAVGVSAGPFSLSRVSWQHVWMRNFGSVTPASTLVFACFSEASDVCFNPFRFHLSPVPSCGMFGCRPIISQPYKPPPLQHHHRQQKVIMPYHRNFQVRSRHDMKKRCGSR